MKVIDVLAGLGLWRMPPTVAALRFPVIVVRSDMSYAFAVDSAPMLLDPRPDWADAPHEGAILIDSHFDMFVEHDTRFAQGELGLLFRRYVGPARPPTYKVDLRRCWRSGPAAARDLLSRCHRFAFDAGDPDRVRRAIAGRPTHAAIVALLRQQP